MGNSSISIKICNYVYALCTLFMVVFFPLYAKNHAYFLHPSVMSRRSRDDMGRYMLKYLHLFTILLLGASEEEIKSEIETTTAACIAYISLWALVFA